MSGSGASNLGYSEFTPNYNINGNYVNATSSNYSAGFTDTTIPIGLRGASSNIMAAQGIARCQSGGSRRKKNKSIYYKRQMRRSSKTAFRKKRTLRKKRVQRKKTRNNRRMRGGDQYGNNVAYTPNYSTGGPLPSGLSALANPVPYHVLKMDGLCPNQYNHYTDSPK